MARKHIVLLSVVAVIILGLALLALVLMLNNDFTNNITIKLKEDGDTYKTIENFSANGLHPGGAPKEYTINLTSSVRDSYIINLSFVETEEGELKNFVEVTITYGEDTQTYLLAELLDGETVTFENVEVANGEDAVITVSYSMPSEIGNEAKGATADFDIMLTATRY